MDRVPIPPVLMKETKDGNQGLKQRHALTIFFVFICLLLDLLAHSESIVFPASRGSLACDSWQENREPLPTWDALFEMPPSTTVDKKTCLYLVLLEIIWLPYQKMNCHCRILQPLWLNAFELLGYWRKCTIRKFIFYFLVRNHKWESLC